MKREHRPGKATDDEQVEKAVKLILELQEFNSNIEGAIWVSAMMYALAMHYKSSGISHNVFKKEMNEAICHYAGIFDE
jgi:hypothetical protein